MATTGGHPQDTMLFCSEMYYLLIETKAAQIIPTLIKLAQERTLLSLAPVFDEMLSYLSGKPLARKVLRRLASGEDVYGGKPIPAKSNAPWTISSKAG